MLRDHTAMMAIPEATTTATEAFDLVLSPVAPQPAFPAEWPMPWGDADEVTSPIGFTMPFNLSGQPAGTVNGGFIVDGRCVRLQVSGRRFDDSRVLAALHWLELHGPTHASPAGPIG